MKKQLKNTKKYYKTVVKVEVLSESPIAELSLSELDYEITNGNWSGEVLYGSPKVLNGKEMAKALEKQGSAPEFFMIDENGEDVNEDEETKDKE
jgi:hypothetical protein